MLRQIVLITYCVLVAGAASCFAASGAWPLPDLKTLSGWKQVGEPDVYDKDTLYEYIDGDAETFFGYGFSALAVVKYANEPGKTAVTLNLYEMNGPLAAFGVYANGRSPEVSVADVGSQGYFAEDGLDLWKGRYYVRVISEGRPQGQESTLLAFGRDVAARIEGQTGEPPETALLPREGRIKNSLRYQPQNVLGQGFLSEAFMADYLLDGAKLQLVVCRRKSPADAAQALVQLRDYVKSSGAVSQQAKDSFFGNDPYYQNILTTVVGSYLVCVLRATDRESAQKLADAFQAGLSRK